MLPPAHRPIHPDQLLHPQHRLLPEEAEQQVHRLARLPVIDREFQSGPLS